jgi:hypothetical protein
MRILMILIILVPATTFSQNVMDGNGMPPVSRNSVTYYLRLFSQSGGTLAPPADDVVALTARLERKRSICRTEKAFLHHLFVKTHQELLSSFHPYATFSDLIEKGHYNCLTATSLYSILLDHFRFSFQVIETNEHIFILCETENGDVLLETTDVVHGFVDTSAGIAKHLDIYRQQSIQAAHSQAYSFSGILMDSVSMTGMLGLLHYNHAAKAYNQKDYATAISHLHHAFLLHRSARMEEFASVMILTIQNTKMMDPRIKQEYVQKILALKRGRLGKFSSTRS